jgi:adenylate cyclase
LDIVMPGLDGLQTLERLKADEALRHTPVIMLSALDEIDQVVRCVEVGADDYLSKPFNPVLLRARITACLEKKRLRDQEQAYLEQLQSEREKIRAFVVERPAPVDRGTFEGRGNNHRGPVFPA